MNGTVTEAGVRNNISVAIQYLSAWLSGNGAVGIFNLMEDAATAEIARAQLWLWVHNQSPMDDGRKVSEPLYRQIRDEEAKKLNGSHLRQAVELLDGLVVSKDFPDFLTLGAYEQLE